MRILFFLLWSSAVSAETSLWQLSKGDLTLYIGGTVHMLSPKDYPLPAEFEQAYKQADMLVLETDLAAMNNIQTQTQLIQRLIYPEGMSLKDDLNPLTYRTLKEYCLSRKIELSVLNRYKPPMVMIMLMMNELKRNKMSEKGVDSFFNQKAIKDGKALGELESVETQLDVIANMGKDHADELILNTIQEMKTLPQNLTLLKAAWRKGRLDKLEQIAVAPLREEFPMLYDDLLVQRNQAWLPKIEALIATPETELILVGALHLVAKEGLLAQLKMRGYQVKKF